MGLLLRPDVYYAESPTGLCVLTHGGPLTFTGSSVYRLFECLVPYLDGGHSLADLTEHLSGDRKERVHQLITALCDQGVIRETTGVPAETSGEFRHEIAFLGYFVEGAAERFAAYRDRRAVIIGAGGQVVPLAVAALRSGLRQVVVAPTAEVPTDLRSLERLDSVRLRDGSEEAVSEAVDGADLVFHVSDRPMPGRARLLENLCGEAGILLAQAMPWAGTLWLVVTGPDAAKGTGWSSGRRRLAAWHRPEAEAAPELVGGYAATVVNRLVRQAFLEATELSPGSAGRMIRIDASTLRGDTHVFLPHPFSRRGDKPCTDEFAGLPPLGREEFSRRAAACADDRLGLFGPPAEHRLTQLPLRVCAMEVADPVGLAGGTIEVTGAGLDFATARHAAALRAFAAYASLMVDPRRLVDADGAELVAADDDPDDALAAVRAGRLTGYVRAYDLAGEPAGLLEAARVFPVLRRPSERDRLGAVAAYGWWDAVGAGLLGRCRSLALADMVTGGGRVRRIPIESVELDGAGIRYLSIAAALGRRPEIYDITGRLGVPTVVCEMGAAAGAASGLSLATAVRDAMEQAILRHQALTNHEPGYAPPPVPAVPRRLRTDRHDPYDRHGEPADETPLDPAGIATLLAERGLAPRVVPLDHDPEVSAVMPYTVSVVLADV